MKKIITTDILQLMQSIAQSYYRLILVVGPKGSGKSDALADTQKMLNKPLINLNLSLSCQMLAMTERKRILEIDRLFNSILISHNVDTLFIDNIEMLFDPKFQRDPLELLKKLSRNMNLIVAWNGYVKDGYLIYADPSHHEYRRYSLKGLLFLDLAEYD